MKFFVPLRPLLLGWLFAFLVWLVFAFVVAIALVSNASLDLSEAFQPTVHEWLPWAVLAPLVFRLTNRFPIERARWGLPLALHLVACLAATGLIWAWGNALSFGPRPLISYLRDTGPGPGPGPRDGMEFGDRPEPPRRSGSEPDDRPSRRDPPPGEPFGKGPGGGPGPMMRGGGPGFSALEHTLMTLSRVAPLFLVFTCAAHAALYYRRAREREASLARARLESLRMQLQPHFLFNTLNTISGLVHDEPDRADAVLTALSELLRLSLQTSSEQELPLRREMEFVERYLAIMHARFEDRVRFTIRIEPETREALVPTFVLQPLVENSVHHGLEPRPSGGCVTISSRVEGERLVLTVEDDGVGTPTGGATREGIGLGNTRARLRELYGDRARMELHPPASGEGFVVSLFLPFRTGS